MDDKSAVDIDELSFWNKHQFLLLIFFVIVIAGILVSVGMILYNSSGAAQLDLSRPGYVDVRDKTIDSTVDFKNYSNFGIINQSSIDEFKDLYDEQANKTKAADAFKGDPLSPDALGINNIVE